MKKVVIVSLISLLIILFSIVAIFMLFPRKYREDVERYAREYNLSASMVASVINIESSYDEMAVSKVGAIGLMQLLPETAFDCAARVGIEVSEEQLFDKDINIRLGCFYLRYLLDLFDGNIVNTLCAYNWGYGNVRNWISLGNVDSMGTITNVPASETRNYLKKYRVSCWFYQKIYKY